MDALTLEAVVGTDGEVELLDRGSEALGVLLVNRAGTDLDALGVGIELTRQTEQLDKGLTGRGDGVARLNARLGLDVDDELVEVGALLDSGGLDLVGDLEDRGVDGVDGDPTDLGVRVVVEGAGHVAASTLDDELHLEAAIVVEGGDVQVRVVDGHTGRRVDVGSGDLAGAGLAQVHSDGLVLLRGEDQALEVQDDLGDVLDTALDGGELVLDSLDLDARHGGARDGRQQGATQRVADGVAEAGLQGLDDELRAELGDGLLGEGGTLCDEHVFYLSRRPLYEGAEGNRMTGTPRREVIQLLHPRVDRSRPGESWAARGRPSSASRWPQSNAQPPSR